jgi:hypothetical protein
LSKGLPKAKAFTDLNLEQQAELIQVAQAAGFYDAGGQHIAYRPNPNNPPSYIDVVVFDRNDPVPKGYTDCTALMIDAKMRFSGTKEYP